MEVCEIFAKLAEWVKQAVYRIVVEEIVADFASAGHVVEVPEKLLLEHEKPSKRGRKNG